MKESRDISPVTIQKQIFDTRDDKQFIMMKIFKMILASFCLCIGLYLLAMIQEKPNDIYKLILEALFVFFGIMIFNKSLPYKIFFLINPYKSLYKSLPYKNDIFRLII